ncbi:glycosyltransferase family 4 protein [Lactiplantibacillus plantarum]|uniref:glycosyltransferase family 4 protein n=1 Tax=Lactiplantibacillus plantarum TaxID=1590 RepID=UPI0006CB2BC5|nr:glycosyltransferase family 4 protein [Lactiplantibacillus plantarum]ALF13828.1 glycosyl transferase family 1 [Lactiplantibacillus plantarum]MDX3787407.1 glycosyltransferase family 4 protein [Lactiplantibacillus plantarum]MDX3813056.1 glycosyltransferase family 4 protein [Lactiplantibacillus plantarum]MDX3858546.1 glycosyltransferase family 4 protein [Lactiplantibacillus plantarum]QKX10196.1 O-antigen biosynthesis glycosyltransferase WbnH [Lactiplantibacillus plantarum]
MRIVYVITQATWGGAQAHLYSLIKQQVKLNNTVTLVSGIEGRLSRQVQKELPQVKLVIIPYLVRQVSIINDFKAIKFLRKLLRQLKPDILHLHSSKAGMVGRIAAIGLSTKVIFTVHGWGFTPGVAKKQQILIRVIEKILRPLTTCYICVSKFDYNLGVKNGIITKRHPGLVIYNGVREVEGVNYDSFRKSFVLTMAARFNTQKRQDLLIQALKYIPEDMPIACHFLGEGPLIVKSKRLVKEFQLEEKVKFVGEVDNVQKYYQQSDGAILISDYEGLPISLVEALAQRLPIIASDVGGNEELVQHNGFLVKNDPQEIAEKIILLYESDEKDKMQNNSYEKFKHDFTESEMLKQTQKCYSYYLSKKF